MTSTNRFISSSINWLRRASDTDQLAAFVNGNNVDKRKEARSQSMVPERSPSSICKLPPQRSLDIPLELEEPPADVLIDPSSIVTSEEANYLSQHYLPARHVGNQWHLLFSTESHGFSLSTIYRLAKTNDSDLQAPMIILIQDISHHRFGAYLSESLKFLDKSYGSGETFVFQLMNLEEQEENNENNGIKIEKKLEEKHTITTSTQNISKNEIKIEKKLEEKHTITTNTTTSTTPQNNSISNTNLKNVPKVYKWTSQNSLFVMGSQDSFAVGIDDGKFAIYLDSSLNQGRSQECQTFANEPLTPEEDFIVKTMEIWTFR